MAGWINMPLGTEVGLDPSNIVLDGDSAALPKKGQSPQFSAHVYCGQMAVWTKMPPGMEVGFGPGQLPVPKIGGRVPHPNFWPMSIVAKQLYGSSCHLIRR